jgi:hypothetical protein
MIPGLPITISCPHCGYLAMQMTFMSRNTIGAKHWSDGKTIAKMYPELPRLVCCKKCENFYWVSKAFWSDRFSSDTSPSREQTTIEYVEFPTFHQYFKALDTISDEYYIRKRIWQSFNDYYRNGRENEITADMVELNNENLEKLLPLVDDEFNDSDVLIKAEILRNQGRFEESRQLLGKVRDPELQDVKEQYLAEIEKKNKNLFRIL